MRFGILGLALPALVLTTACTSSGPKHASAIPTPHPAAATATPGAIAPTPTPAATCSYRPSSAVLPTWARTGFSSPYNVWRHVTSKSGNVVGVLFNDPLHVGTPGSTKGQNKILWVARAPAVGPMTIDAELVGSTERVQLGHVPIGPSNVDVPRAGCWHLILHLASGDDSVDLVYDPA